MEKGKKMLEKMKEKLKNKSFWGGVLTAAAGLLTGALNLGAAAADTLSESSPAEVMRVSSAAISIMLAILICYAVMILGALAMVLLAGS